MVADRVAGDGETSIARLRREGVQLAGAGDDQSAWEMLQEKTADIVVTARKEVEGFFGKIDRGLGGIDRFFSGLFGGGKSSSRDRAYETSLIIRASSGPSYRNNEEGSYFFAPDHPITGNFTVQSRVAMYRAGDAIGGLVDSRFGSAVGDGLDFLYRNTLGPGTPYDVGIATPINTILGLVPEIDPGLVMTLESNQLTAGPGAALGGLRSLQSLRAGAYAAEGIVAESNLGSLTAGEALRIQTFADKYGTTVNVVGSRAQGTAGPLSDFDYILGNEGATSRLRAKARIELPRGRAGGEIHPSRGETGIDVFKSPLDPTRPYIPFNPKAPR